MNILNIKLILKKYARSKFVQNILVLFSGTAISQIIPFLFIPVLSRMFSDNQFGELFLYSSVISVLTVIATLRYEIAIVLPKNKDSAIHLLVLSFLIAILLCFLLYLIILGGKEIILSYLEKKNIHSRWLYFIPLSVLCIGIIQSGNFWLNRNARFKQSSYGKILKSSSTIAFQSSTGKSLLNPVGLIGGLIVGQVIHGLFMIGVLIKSEVFRHFKFSTRRMRKIACYYREIPEYNTISGMINMVSNNLPIFLFTSYYGIDAVGIYGMAMKLTVTPLTLVNSAIGEVFYSTASKLYHNDRKEFERFTLNITKKLAKAAIIPFILLFIIAPKLFNLILGPAWNGIEVGMYTQIILPWLFFMFLNVHLTSLITILRKQKEYLYFSALFLICRFIALYIGYSYFNSIIYSLAFYSVTGVIFNIFFLIYILKLNKTSVK